VEVGLWRPFPTLSGGIPRRVVARDLDGDGKPDIIVAPRTGDSVIVLKNTSVTPGFSFVSGATYCLKAMSSPSALLLEDLTGGRVSRAGDSQLHGLVGVGVHWQQRWRVLGTKEHYRWQSGLGAGRWRRKRRWQKRPGGAELFGALGVGY
jgi:hypothetical protein